MWPFRKKPPTKPTDLRDWNDDWKVGDVAECINGPDNWHDNVRPWERLEKGSRWTVTGFSEGLDRSEAIRYFLELEGCSVDYPTTSFRKVRPVATEQSEVVNRILNAPAGPDRVREDA